LVAEVLNFQGMNPILGMGSLSNLCVKVHFKLLLTIITHNL